ncbi:MAG TPA: hypothetical protein VEB64_15000 [Azospirillaceae bacterium]|nr:hypothetical protein [Azospirillaceae bacterium]
MPLTAEQIDAIASLANARFTEGASLDAAIKAIKGAFPELTVTGCLESDMTQSPYREETGYFLFLVDRSAHCWTITGDPEKATGVVIAKREEED